MFPCLCVLLKIIASSRLLIGGGEQKQWRATKRRVSQGERVGARAPLYFPHSPSACLLYGPTNCGPGTGYKIGGLSLTSLVAHDCWSLSRFP